MTKRLPRCEAEPLDRARWKPSEISVRASIQRLKKAVQNMKRRLSVLFLLFSLASLTNRNDRSSTLRARHSTCFMQSMIEYLFQSTRVNVPHTMTILLSFFILHLCILPTYITRGLCANDDDLQRHRCVCSLIQQSVRCSSLPHQCQTCYRYRTIEFDKKVTRLTAEAFRSYRFFDGDDPTRNSFEVRFAQLDVMPAKTFSKLSIGRNRTLEIRIVRYSSPSLPSGLLDGMTIERSAQVQLTIANVTSAALTVNAYAFNGSRFNDQSEFRLSVLSAKDQIQFEPNAGEYERFSSLLCFFDVHHPLRISAPLNILLGEILLLQFPSTSSRRTQFRFSDARTCQ